MSFLLMVSIEECPGAWLCLEAHAEARFSHLDRFIRRAWFLDSTEPGQFLFSKPNRVSRSSDAAAPALHIRLEKALSVKDRLLFRIRQGRRTVESRVDVIACMPTAIMHRPVDVAAFPLHSESGPNARLERSGEGRDSIGL